MLKQTIKRLQRSVNFRRVVGLYRRRLSQQIFSQCNGIIRHGAFAGMRWLDHPGWGRSDQGVMILGLYEQEVVGALMDAPDHYRTFVDIGAADGYYAVGMLHNNKVDRSVAFEMLPRCRTAIAALAAANGVADRITILGAASDSLIDNLRDNNIDGRETMFLIDIEGAEFRILTKELFAFLEASTIVVETHAHIFPDPEEEIERLIASASATHTVTRWQPGARNPWLLRELDTYTEVDRWILCSEGRVEVQQWLKFVPQRPS